MRPRCERLRRTASGATPSVRRRPHPASGVPAGGGAPLRCPPQEACRLALRRGNRWVSPTRLQCRRSASAVLVVAAGAGGCERVPGLGVEWRPGGAPPPASRRTRPGSPSQASSACQPLYPASPVLPLEPSPSASSYVITFQLGVCGIPRPPPAAGALCAELAGRSKLEAEARSRSRRRGRGDSALWCGGRGRGRPPERRCTRGGRWRLAPGSRRCRRAPPREAPLPLASLAPAAVVPPPTAACAAGRQAAAVMWLCAAAGLWRRRPLPSLCEAARRQGPGRGAAPHHRCRRRAGPARPVLVLSLPAAAAGRDSTSTGRAGPARRLKKRKRAGAAGAEGKGP